jgi:hypothetical protein
MYPGYYKLLRVRVAHWRTGALATFMRCWTRETLVATAVHVGLQGQRPQHVLETMPDFAL